jgi:hypothetical protein
LLKKGAPVGPVEAAALEAAGIKDIIVARLEPGDVTEDVGATRSRRRSLEKACTLTVPSPAAPISLPSRRAC